VVPVGVEPWDAGCSRGVLGLMLKPSTVSSALIRASIASGRRRRGRRAGFCVPSP